MGNHGGNRVLLRFDGNERMKLVKPRLTRHSTVAALADFLWTHSTPASVSYSKAARSIRTLGKSMNVPDYVVSYKLHLARLIEAHGRDAAMEWIVGGQYSQIGILESSALRTLGLQPTDTLIDIGCGSG